MGDPPDAAAPGHPDGDPVSTIKFFPRLGGLSVM
jgi:hypothetical protein